ncbi:MAG: hypothetical protein V3U29_06880 [Phycisphaeraceae bacterium]
MLSPWSCWRGRTDRAASEPSGLFGIAEGFEQFIERGLGFQAVEEVGDQFLRHVRLLQPPKPRAPHDLTHTFDG